MNDTEYYRRKSIDDARHKKARSKAKNRGNVSVQWHKTNKLTADTLSDFKRAMKQADIEWEDQQLTPTPNN